MTQASSRLAVAAVIALGFALQAGCSPKTQPPAEEAPPAAASPAAPEAPVETAPAAAETEAAPETPAAPPEKSARPAAPAPATPVPAKAAPAPAAQPPAPTPVVTAVPAAFASCGGCHSTQEGAPNRMGPNLHGIVGSRAGTRAGYSYSEAMANSDIVWTSSQLDAFLAGPRDVVPGTKMGSPPVSNAESRRSIIEYLSTLD